MRSCSIPRFRTRASKALPKIASRSRIRRTTWASGPTTSTICWAAHAAYGCAVTLTCRIRRLSSERTKNTYSVAIVDATGDGKADIVAVNRGGTVNTVSVLAGNGDGTLGSPGAYPVDNSPLALATGDFDGDGKVDLAVTNIGTNDVSILVGACGKSWPNDGGAGGDATVADATAGDGGQDAGPATWCAEQGTHDFCEDFTEGVPGQMTVAWTPGATVTADTTNFGSSSKAGAADRRRFRLREAGSMRCSA